MTYNDFERWLSIHGWNREQYYMMDDEVISYSDQVWNISYLGPSDGKYIFLCENRKSGKKHKITFDTSFQENPDKVSLDLFLQLSNLG